MGLGYNDRLASLPPFMWVEAHEKRAGDDSEIGIIAYGAYNAFGLIGPEQGGVAIVLEAPGKSVIATKAFPYDPAERAQVVKRLLRARSAAGVVKKAVAEGGFGWRVPANEVIDRLSSKKLKEFKPDTYKFVGEEYMSVDEKKGVLADWCNFVGRGFRQTDFTDRLYRHLINHCSFIAHYDIGGFYEHYFSGTRWKREKFMEQFDPNGDGFSVEIGADYWLRGGYSDLNNAMREEAGKVYKFPVRA